MSDIIELNVEKRTLLGKKVKTLRRDGITPAVIQNHGKDSIHISVSTKDFLKAYGTAGKHHPVKLNIEKEAGYNTLVREVVRPPTGTVPTHIVFQAVDAKEKVTAQVPIHLTGEIPAERASLQVIKSLDHVDVEAIPSELIDEILIDATTLVEVGDKLRVSDIKVTGNVTIKTDPDQLIAIVEMPKDQVADADAAAAEQAEADGATAEGADSAEGEPGDSKSEESSDTKSDDK
ncbi:MAG: 50S ribosomal protein L25, partial [Patescibacteria group bacterium]